MKLLKAYAFCFALFGSALVAKHVEMRPWTQNLPAWAYIAIMTGGAVVYLLLDNLKD